MCDVVYGAHGITLDIDALGTGGGGGDGGDGGGGSGGDSVPEPCTGDLLLGAIATMSRAAASQEAASAAHLNSKREFHDAT